MKLLQFFPLRAPHHPREVFVMALDEGCEPRMLGVTVWETDEPQDTVGVGRVKDALHTPTYGVALESDTQPLVSAVEFALGPPKPVRCCSNPIHECNVNREDCRVRARFKARPLGTPPPTVPLTFPDRPVIPTKPAMFDGACPCFVCQGRFNPKD